MYRLITFILTFVVTLAVGCRREPPEAEEMGPDTAAVDATALAPADSVSQWIRQGESTYIKTPNRKACLFVPDTALVGLGDSVRITIRRWSTGPDTLELEQDLSPAFRAAKEAGRKVFRPIYEIRAYNLSNQEFSEFADSLTVAMCVTYRETEAESFQRTLLARDPGTDSLQLLPWREPPDECDLTCLPREGGPPAQQGAVSLGRWVTGSPVTATPAHGSQSWLTRGLGGGSGGKSLFAAVDTKRGASQAQEP